MTLSILLSGLIAIWSSSFHVSPAPFVTLGGLENNLRLDQSPVDLMMDGVDIPERRDRSVTCVDLRVSLLMTHISTHANSSLATSSIVTLSEPVWEAAGVTAPIAS